MAGSCGDFCERLGIDRCSIVGNSMGGFIASEVAITEPERVDDLTLVSAAGITWARARREPAVMAASVGSAAAMPACCTADFQHAAAPAGEGPAACIRWRLLRPERAAP